MALVRSRRGLQQKFVAAILIVGLLPGIVALFATYRYSTHRLKNTIGDSFQQLAASTARQIEGMVDEAINEARHLAAAPSVVRVSVDASNRSARAQGEPVARARLLERSAEWEHFRAGTALAVPAFINQPTLHYLHNWLTIRPGEYHNVLVTDERGALIAGAHPTVPYLHGDDLWWREAYAEGRGGIYVSDIYEQAPDVYLLDLAVPILDQAGTRAVGVVKFEVRRDSLMKAIMAIRVGERGHGMLLNTEGTPLICPVLSPQAHLINEPLMAQLMQTTPGWVVAEDDAHGGSDSIVGYAPITFTNPLTETSLGGHQWYAFVRQDPDETYAPIYALLQRVGMIGFGLVVALATLGFFVGRRIVQPILLLQAQADTVRQHVRELAAAGRFERLRMARVQPPVAAHTGDELESLALAFTQMTEALDESLATIRNQEDELLRQEKLASVGRLLAALAHDIKNPLGVIRSSAQIVLDERQPETVKREVAQYVIEEADRLTNRINHFLRFARQKPPDTRPVAPRLLLDAALREWEALGKGEAITTQVQVPDGVADLLVDADQVKEALVNLMINARDAMPHGGTLTLSAAAAPDGSAALAAVDLCVVDSGVGIKPEHRRQIFAPFFTTKDSGTGLGLTNAKRLVEENGGTLELYSTEGRGTEVWIRLPASPERPHKEAHG